MLDFDSFISQIENSCSKYDVRRLTVFGSALREDFQEASDVDFLVEFHNAKNGLHRYISLKEELENILNRPVDLVMPDALKNKRLIEHIYENTRDLYVA